MAVTDVGVLAWCDSIRFTMARDPGRELFATQIQQHGFDFLDNYIEDVLARQPTESLYDLMKTPGKRKDAAKRKRTAPTAPKLAAVGNTMFEEKEEGKENSVLVNDFHKALLDAREEMMMMRSSEDPRPTVKKNIPKTVTILDSPSTSALTIEEDQLMYVETATPQKTPPSTLHVERIAEVPAVQEVDEIPESSTKQISHSPLLASPAAQTTSPFSETRPVDSPPQGFTESEPPKELSMIAEDDESSEQSGVLKTVPIEQQLPAPILGSTDYDMDQDIAVPLRDDSTSGTLKRKQSATQFSGLPAPSPLRKSMRMSRELSIGTGLLAPSLSQTPGPVRGGKRTSWLTKAKEAKALELTVPGKKYATFSEGTGPNLVGLGLGLPSALREISSRPSSRDVFDTTPMPSNSSGASVKDNDVDMKIDQLEVPPQISRKKSVEDDSAGHLDTTQAQQQSLTLPARHAPQDIQLSRQDLEDLTVPLNEEEAEIGALNRLKRALEGAGARSFRSIGKSLGGNAAAALAEARAAAEARVAQRNKDTSADISVVEVETATLLATEGVKPAEPQHPLVDERVTPSSVVSTPLSEADKRLSLSDLVSQSSLQTTEQTSLVNVAQPSPEEVNTSISTTPPNSPPVVVQNPSVPLFRPVLEHPASKASAESKVTPPTTSLPPFFFKLPGANPFTLPAQNTLDTQSATPVLLDSKPLSAESSKGSIFTDNIFDKPGAARGWMPVLQDTQDTDFSTNPTQPQQDDMDDDDSWHIDEKFRANETWTPYGFVNNDKTGDTWSTLPTGSTSRHGETEPTHGFAEALRKAAQEPNENYVVHAEDDDRIPGAFDFDPKFAKAQLGITEEDLEDLQEVDMDLDDDIDQVDLDDIVAAGKTTISLVQKPSEPPRSQSQMFLNSTSTSSSQGNGFLGQASRFMSSMLSTSKPKAKNEPVKSIIRAAAIAKKQQEEADKKASRMKEMENRRQQAMQRKADEEKARADEEEKRIKEENERRKREREEHTGKLPIPKAMKKTDDDTMSKRKLAETLKKPESKKPPSKDTQSTRTLKPPSSINAHGTSSKEAGPLKSTLSKQASSSSIAASAAVKDATATRGTVPPSIQKAAAAKGKSKAVDKGASQPSDIVQGQMADRAKAQIQAAQTPRQPPPVASESIELPDINSEYSDSEDEDRPKSFNLPEWAQSPELRQQLEDQSRYNPDDIFGRIGPLRMEEIFRTRQSRFRARTSSANWAGPDELTEYEEREYARRMGYTSKP
ncbi:hypothetical protein BDY19DRAFT_1080697 [Irpex rosettiformis]|uniref:Uncharacterized protein n=1 Tax=Irpex rosettiformis TaxID=378272 RepID=A0ACB8UL47_9APHY|nr:hypothetical protein BDY19DRAFT_1080697 [Irpex rosettiformis]